MENADTYTVGIKSPVAVVYPTTGGDYLRITDAESPSDQGTAVRSLIIEEMCE